MDAHEQIAAVGAVAAPVAQRDEGVGRPGHPDADPAALELIANQQADLQGDVFLPDPAGEEHPGVARIDSAVAGVDRHHVAGQEPVGQAAGSSRGGGAERGAASRAVDRPPASTADSAAS